MRGMSAWSWDGVGKARIASGSTSAIRYDQGDPAFDVEWGGMLIREAIDDDPTGAVPYGDGVSEYHD
jgi:hypothetical protein